MVDWRVIRHISNIWYGGGVPKPLPLLQDVGPICCAPLGVGAPLSEQDAIGLAIRLKALADPVRLRLVAFLLDRPEREACTCDLAPHVGLTEPTVSHHLKTLETAGLVAKERRGINVYYRVVTDAIDAVASTLTTRHTGAS